MGSTGHFSISCSPCYVSTRAYVHYQIRSPNSEPELPSVSFVVERVTICTDQDHSPHPHMISKLDSAVLLEIRIRPIRLFCFPYIIWCVTVCCRQSAAVGLWSGSLESLDWSVVTGCASFGRMFAQSFVELWWFVSLPQIASHIPTWFGLRIYEI